jgi:type I restriction enzyme S subunit
MIQSELGMIPKGWGVSQLGNIIDISSGNRPKQKSKVRTKDFSVPLAGAASVTGYVREYNYSKPVIVIGRVGTHGVIQRYTERIWASDNTLVIDSKYNEYVYQILGLIDYKSLNRGSTQPLITQKDVKCQIIIFPVKNVLKNYEDKISKIFQSIETRKTESYRLSQIRDSLLPKLMSGEIRVPLKTEEASMKVDS